MALATLDYADFDYYISDPEAIAILDFTEPIDGDSSLLVSKSVTGVSSPRVSFAPKTAVYPSQGLTLGRLRVRITGVPDSGTPGFGLLCLQSQRNLTGSSGAAYGLQFHGSSPHLLQLIKYTNGMLGGYALLASAGITIGAVHALQLDWAVAEDASWVVLYGWYGQASDYSDVERLLFYQDITSPLVTTVTEGGFYDDAGSGLPFAYRYDTLQLFGPPPAP